MKTRTKVIWALIPACMTGGPMLMSDMAGIWTGRAPTVLPGVILTTAALCMMFDLICEQHGAIEKLKEELRTIKESTPR